MLRFKTYLMERVKKAMKFEPAKLTIRDLQKDKARVDMFIKKVKEGEPFSTITHGSDVIINKDQFDEIELFLTVDKGYPAARSTLIVKTNKGDLKIPNSFYKTGEFGGRGKGSGVAAETRAMNNFNERLQAILKKEGVPYIDLLINGRTIRCAEMVKTEGKYQNKEPKSDMTIVNSQGEPVAYISHKAGRSAKDYQQYGGVSNAALPPKYHDNAFIKKFMQDVQKIRPEGLESGDSFYRKITDDKLVRMMMYGPEYGGSPGISNVDEFHLGEMELKKSGTSYKITSAHKGTNGEIPTGQFEALLFIRFQSRRGDARAASEVVKNARIGIFPRAKLSSTSKEI